MTDVEDLEEWLNYDSHLGEIKTILIEVCDGGDEGHDISDAGNIRDLLGNLIHKNDEESNTMGDNDPPSNDYLCNEVRAYQAIAAVKAIAMWTCQSPKTVSAFIGSL